MQGCPSQDVPSPVPASTSAAEERRRKKKSKKISPTVYRGVPASRTTGCPSAQVVFSKAYARPRTRIPREDEILRAFSVAVPPHPGPVLFLFSSRSFSSFLLLQAIHPPVVLLSFYLPIRNACSKAAVTLLLLAQSNR